MPEVDEQTSAAQPASQPVAVRPPFTERRRIPRRPLQTGDAHSIGPGNQQQQQQQQQRHPLPLPQPHHPTAQQPLLFIHPSAFSSQASSERPPSDLSAGFAQLSLSSSQSSSSIPASSFDSRPSADGYRGAYRGVPVCFRCRRAGHKVRDCREPPPFPASQAQTERSRPVSASAADTGSQLRHSAGQPLQFSGLPPASAQSKAAAARLSSSQPSQPSQPSQFVAGSAAAQQTTTAAPAVPVLPEPVPTFLPPSYPPVSFPPADDEKAAAAFYTPAALLRSVTEDHRRDPLWLKFGRLECGLLWFLFIFENQRERRKGSSGLHVYADRDFPDSWGRPVLGSARCAFSLNEHDRQCWRLIRFLRVFLAHGRVSALRDERQSADDNDRLIRHLYADVWSVMYFLTQSCHFGSQDTDDSAQSVRAVCDQHALADLTPEGRALRHHRLSLPLRFFHNSERGVQHLDFTSRWYTADDCRHEAGRRAVMDFGLLSDEFRAYLILMLHQYFTERLQPRKQRSVLSALVNAESMRPKPADSAAATTQAASRLALYEGIQRNAK